MGILNNTINKAKKALNSGFTKVANGVNTVVNTAKTLVNNSVQKVTTIVSNTAKKAANTAVNIAAKGVQVVQGVVNSAKNFVSGAVNSAKNVVNTAKTIISGGKSTKSSGGNSYSPSGITYSVSGVKGTTPYIAPSPSLMQPNSTTVFTFQPPSLSTPTVPTNVNPSTLYTGSSNTFGGTPSSDPFGSDSSGGYSFGEGDSLGGIFGGSSQGTTSNQGLVLAAVAGIAALFFFGGL